MYRYTFSAAVCIESVEIALLWAIWGAECLHGASVARLDARYFFDRKNRQCIVDARSAAGRDLNKLLVGYLERHLGRESFRVCRVEPRKTTVAEKDFQGAPAEYTVV